MATRRADRQQRIARAERIVLTDPNTTKRALQSRLKAEFGVGLSDTTRRNILQRANTVNVLRARVNTPAFTHNERVILRHAIHRTGNAPYLAKAINDRFTAGRRARNEGLTRRQFFTQVRKEARDSGMLATHTTRSKKDPYGTVKGQVDWWRVLRDYRDKDIERGDYIPKIGPKPKSDKGDIKAQKARYQEKQSAKAHARWVERERSRLQTWITQKENAIEVSSGQRRRQLITEKHNLERTLRSIH